MLLHSIFILDLFFIVYTLMTTLNDCYHFYWGEKDSTNFSSCATLNFIIKATFFFFFLWDIHISRITRNSVLRNYLAIKVEFIGIVHERITWQSDSKFFLESCMSDQMMFRNLARCDITTWKNLFSYLTLLIINFPVGSHPVKNLTTSYNWREGACC